MDYEEINSGIRNKTKGCVQRLKDRQSSLGMKHSSTDPLTKITNKFSNNAGMIDRIRFNFKKSGIYVHKGVGRGTKASEVGSTKRKPEEWFNPVIEEFADELIDVIADATVILAFEKMKIK